MNLLPLLTIDVEATVRPANISPSAPYVDAWTREARKGLARRPVNDFSVIHGDSELRDLARVDAREFVK